MRTFLADTVKAVLCELTMYVASVIVLARYELITWENEFGSFKVEDLEGTLVWALKYMLPSFAIVVAITIVAIIVKTVVARPRRKAR